MAKPLNLLLELTNSPLQVRPVTKYQLPNGFRKDYSFLITAYNTGNEAKIVFFTSYDILI